MDVDKTMQFILEQQAKQEASLQQTDELLLKVGAIQLQQAEILSQHDSQIGQLIQSQRRTDETVKDLAEAVKGLAEQGRHTDERLNALIKVVDDLIRRDGSRP